MNAKTKIPIRILSALLTVLLLAGIVPLNIFAFSGTEGSVCSSRRGDKFIGYDGEAYSAPKNYDCILYNTDGSTYVEHRDGYNFIWHLLIIDSNGNETDAYCVESGVDFEESTNAYTSLSGTNSRYYRNLPYTAQFGIMLTSLYGWNEGKSLPIGGINTDDYILATQIIIWEYQQGLRTSPGGRINNGTIPADLYYNSIKERPAELAYNWILNQMSNHYIIPSFSARSENNAETLILKWNQSVGKYMLTVTDANGTLSNIKFDNSDIQITRDGNKYTISSSKSLSSAVNVKCQKNINVVGGPFLIWGRPGYQTMMCGAEDPVYFFFKVKTESDGVCRIKKTSEDSSVSGISFNISGNGVNKDVTTKSDGIVDITLKPGVYTVTEQNYDKYEPQESRQVTVVSGKTAMVTFNNKLRRGDLTVTKTAEDGLTQGMKFHLYGTSLSGLSVDEYAIVGANGKAHFQGVLIGKGYTLEEVDTPDRYIVPEKQKTDIEWNKVTGKSFDNNLKRGDLTVTKTAEDGLTEGLQFHLYGTSYSGIAVDEYATVGSDGKAYFQNILIGQNYTLEETGIPDKYVVPASQTAAIEWNKVTERSFDNRLKKWNLTVKKSDAETGNAQGDASLDGAVYGVYKGDKLIDRYTTDANGCFTTIYYLCDDDWSLREITPSEGYLIDASSYHIGAETENYTIEYNAVSSSVTENIIKGNIAIIKHTDDGSTQLETPEAGAEFELFLKQSDSYASAKESERDILTCDENGFAQSKNLPYGVYTVHQTKGWEGRELLPDFDVFISEDGQTYRYLANNDNFESYIKVIKTDAETGLTIPYAGAAFQLYDPNGNKIVMSYTYPEYTEIDTFYTTADGMLITPQKLAYGKNYSLVETHAPYGYVLDSTPVYFDVAADTAADDGAITVVKINKPNMPQKGRITITKTGEIFSSVTAIGGGYIDENGNDIAFSTVYKPVYSVQGISGAVYEVRAAEDIYTPDGTLRYARGSIVSKVTTDRSGKAVTHPLYLGKYEIREVKAPYGMLLNGEIHFAELTYAGQDIEITDTSVSFYNERQKVSVSLEKFMEQNEKFSIGQNNEILSVQFGLFALEDLIAADGSIIPKDGLLETVRCDTDGKAGFSADLPAGASCYVKEIATDNQYILSNEKFPVVFEYAGQETAVVDIHVNDGEPIINSIVTGDVKGLKLDRETEETMSGAVFGLFAPNETVFTAETALLTAESGSDGVFIFEDVPYGSWLIKELQPADNYLPNEKIYPVQIAGNEEVIEITVVNDRVPEIGTNAAVDGEKEIGATEVFTLEDIVSYRHLIPGKEYTVSGVLMDKATGEPLLINDEEIHAETVFVPDAPSGEVTVSFHFDSKYIKTDTDIVVFESLYCDGKGLAVHMDIEDEDQTVTVRIPIIGTTAAVEDKQKINATEVFTLEDVVAFQNLTPGKEYVIKGVLMDKTTGKALVIDGEEIRSDVKFAPEAADGEVVVSFVFDSRVIKEETDIVAYETLYRENIEIARHTDIEDKDQTVSVFIPEIGTQASIEGNKGSTVKDQVTIEDIVSYKNLTPGKEYTVKGVLMDKSTVSPLLIDGKEICLETTFIPETSNGKITLTFTFEGKYLKKTTEIVVFETLYREDMPIAVHADLEDVGQTVTVQVPPPPPSDSPQTGDTSHMGLWLALIAVSGTAIVWLSIRRRRYSK